MAPRGGLQSPLLGGGPVSPDAPRRRGRPWTALAIAMALLALAGVLLSLSSGGEDRQVSGARLSPHEVESGVGAAAADDGRCSEVGAAALRAGGHAVDAAVASVLCLGVVHPMSSGVGGGAFIVVRDAASGEAVAFDARETAPAAATALAAGHCLVGHACLRTAHTFDFCTGDQSECATEKIVTAIELIRKLIRKGNMYESNPSSKYKGALAMGIPGELAGLHAAWSRYGRLPWKDLFAPAIGLAREGYTVVPYVASKLKKTEQDVLSDPGLRGVFAPEGRLLEAGEVCRNPALADTLEAVANEGVAVFYDGSVGERFVNDVRRAGGIATMDDLRGYKVKVSDATRADAMGYTILGMPPPSSGTVGMALVLNILGGYKSLEFLKGFLGVHRFIEAFKHMLAIRMDLGDPDFVNVTGSVSEMLSSSFADKIRQRIVDNTTFPPSYYLPKWSQLRDHGTSHVCIIDGDRNAVAMTTTVNYYFGAHLLSPSTGIVVNNEMDNFSVPAERTPDHLPPAPANFIAPGKRPLSSMTPAIILKNEQLAGVIGGSGGTYIIPAVTQVFLNHFIVNMHPLAAVQHPRVYHKLVPNVVVYENETVIDGELIEFSSEAREFLKQRGHWLASTDSGAVCQLIVQDLLKPVSGRQSTGRSTKLPQSGGENVFHGMLTAVSDPRKDGRPAGL